MKKININNKVISIFYQETIIKKLPVVILNTFDNEGLNVWNKCLNLKTKEFILVSITGMNWNNDLTPWESLPLYQNETKYLGNASSYLKEIEEDFLPQIEDFITKTLKKEISFYVLAGYSLAGLFAFYSSFKTNKFRRIVSASGSLWYPNLMEFVRNNRISNNIDKIYFSLGNKEANTKNKLLSTVMENTKEICNYVSKEISTIYEENEGNHFKDETLRIAKGIRSVLEE